MTIDQPTTNLTKIEQDIEKLFLRINESIEMAAAKIIKEINDSINKCECNKTLLESLNSNKQLTSVDEEESLSPKSYTGLKKYSYPNYMVGNENLGSSKDPQSLSWPFGK